LEVVEKRGSEVKELDVLNIFDKIYFKKTATTELRSIFLGVLRETSTYNTSLSREECTWMLNHMDWIAKIIKSKKASIVFWCLFRYNSPYIQEMGRYCNSRTDPIRHWIIKFRNMWIVDSRPSLGSSIYYFLNIDIYPNIIGAFLKMIEQEHGRNYLDLMTTPQRDQEGNPIDIQGDSVKEAQRKKTSLNRSPFG